MTVVFANEHAEQERKREDGEDGMPAVDDRIGKPPSPAEMAAIPRLREATED